MQIIRTVICVGEDQIMFLTQSDYTDMTVKGQYLYVCVCVSARGKEREREQAESGATE